MCHCTELMSTSSLTSCLSLFQAEDRFCDWSQTSGGPSGAAHPGLHDAHQHLHTGEHSLHPAHWHIFPHAELTLQTTSCVWCVVASILVPSKWAEGNNLLTLPVPRRAGWISDKRRVCEQSYHTLSCVSATFTQPDGCVAAVVWAD